MVNYRTCFQHASLPFTHKRPKRSSLSLHHLLFLIYIFINLLIVYFIQADTLPLRCLGIIPSLSLCTPLYFVTMTRSVNASHPSRNNHVYPSRKLHTNSDKLCYLTAWKSSILQTSKLMRFSSNRAVCIDTGASWTISNNKDDFISLLPSPPSTVIKGISNGLSIQGTGTVRWPIINDDGNEITLHLHNFLYMPEAPMCLLSPQHLAQQTKHTSDGFHATSSSGILTFAGFHRTIPCNSTNNLPIFFLSSTIPPTSQQHQDLALLTRVADRFFFWLRSGPSVQTPPRTGTGPTDRLYVCFVPEMYGRSPRIISRGLQ